MNTLKKMMPGHNHTDEAARTHHDAHHIGASEVPIDSSNPTTHANPYQSEGVTGAGYPERANDATMSRLGAEPNVTGGERAIPAAGSHFGHHNTAHGAAVPGETGRLAGHDHHHGKEAAAAGVGAAAAGHHFGHHHNNTAQGAAVPGETGHLAGSHEHHHDKHHGKEAAVAGAGVAAGAAALEHHHHQHNQPKHHLGGHHGAAPVGGATAGAGGLAGAQGGAGDLRVAAESGNNFPGTNPDPAHSALGAMDGRGLAFPGTN